MVLKDMLLDYADRLGSVGHAQSLEEAELYLNQQRPDLVFLDIFLPDGDGFQLLKRRILPDNCRIIFTTAYEAHALRAFEFAALHYLLKPLDPLQLDEAMQRFFAWQAGQKGLTEESTKIVLATQKQIVHIEPEELLYLQAEGSYTHVCLRDQRRLMVSRSLSHYERQVPDNLFVRIHDRYLVNIQGIKAYEKHKSGGLVLLENGESLEVSARRRSSLLQKIRFGEDI